MSYSIADANLERQDCVQQAIKDEDYVQLRTLSEMFQREEEFETAEWLLELAKRFNRDDWAYDEARDNELTDHV